MTAVTEDNITAVVIDAMAAETAPRTRELMASFVRHLHDFARETRLSLDEFVRICRFLVRAGQISSDKRDEFILMSNIVGLEVLLDIIAHEGELQTTVLGPMYREQAPCYPKGGSIVLQAPADAQTVYMEGHVRTPAGAPIAGALIDVWEPSTNGLYDSQDSAQPDMNLRGRFDADGDGHYALRCLRPVSYPIPYDGPGGELLTLLGRHPMRPAHIHVIVSAAGCAPLVAQVYDSTDPYLDNDSIFAVKDALIGVFEPAPPALATDLLLRRDWVLQPLPAR